MSCNDLIQHFPSDKCPLSNEHPLHCKCYLICKIISTPFLISTPLLKSYLQHAPYSNNIIVFHSAWYHKIKHCHLASFNWPYQITCTSKCCLDSYFSYQSTTVCSLKCKVSLKTLRYMYVYNRELGSDYANIIIVTVILTT